MTAQPTMTVKRDKRGNPESVEFNNVQLFYVKLDRPVAVFNERKSANPTKTEYTVDFAVTEEIADEWDEMFPKQPAKKFTNAKFREQFRLEEDDELPVPDAKKQFTIKVKQGSKNKDGSFRSGKARPRVFQIEDGKAKDITFKSKVGNGSVGGILVRAAYNGELGNHVAYLSAVKVTDLIEYEGSSAVNDFLGGEAELDEEGENEAVQDQGSANSGDQSAGDEDQEEDEGFGEGTVEDEDDEEYN